MNIIKTVNEVVFDRINECADALTKQYMKSVRPIYGTTKHGKPYHIGSCALIEVDACRYLVTAAHVIDHNIKTTLYVGGETDLIEIEGETLITEPITRNRDDDKLDFAIIPLSADIITKLRAIVFINESSILNTPPVRKGELFFLLGFPNSKNKKANSPEKKVTQNPFIYSSTLILDSEIFKDVGAMKSQHYLLDFCSEYSRDENNNLVNSIAPKGTSGGALFFIEGMNNPDNYRPNAKCTGKLVGIPIENHKNKKVIMVTKISIIIDVIRNYQSRHAHILSVKKKTLFP